MANPFDQFDAQAQANPFDQFDIQPETPAPEPLPTPSNQTPVGVQPVTPSDPYFLPIEAGYTEAVPPAPGGKKKLSEFSAKDLLKGGLEAGLSTATGSTTGMATGAAGGFVGMLGDLANILSPEEAQELQQRWAAFGTYEPGSDAGRRLIEEAGGLVESLPPVSGSPTPRVRIGKEGRTKALPEQTARAERFSQETGAPLMATDIDQPTTFTGKSVRSIGEKVPLAGTGSKRAKQQEARTKVVGDYLETFDQVTDQDLYNSLVKSQDKRKQAISKRYDEVGDQMGDKTVPPTKTISAIDNEIAELTKPGKVQSPEVIAKLNELKEQLRAGEVNYKDMRNNRTLIRETLKSDDSKTISDRVIDRIYRAMTDDIQSEVESTLGKESAMKLRQVDKLLFDQYQETKKTKLKNVLNKGEVKPEEVTKMLMSNDRSEVSKLYRELDNNGRNNARSLIAGELKKVFDESESPEKFLLKAKKLGNQMDVFFKGDNKETYLDLVSYLKQTKQAANAGVLNQNGQQLMSLISLAPAADLAGGGGVVTAGAAGLGLMGRALESRGVRKALRNLKKTRPYTPEYNQALIALDNAVEESQADEGE